MCLILQVHLSELPNGLQQQSVHSQHCGEVTRQCS
uniref:Uncharacterized protein n=1 Tax=Anguilla anguilla TaxID=7936 RepID=A0A0E9WFL1_ANGAN